MLSGATVCKTVRLCYRTVVCCLSCSVCAVRDVGVLWPNSWMDQDATWYGDRPRPTPQCIRWGPSSPPPKKESTTTIFDLCLLWSNGWMDRDATWYEGRPRPRHTVLDGDPAPPPPQKGAQQPPLFGPCVLWPSGAHLSNCWALVDSSSTNSNTWRQDRKVLKATTTTMTVIPVHLAKNWLRIDKIEEN